MNRDKPVNKFNAVNRQSETDSRHQVAAAGGVLFRVIDDQAEVLLIHRKNVWDLPKGKLDKGESIAYCAAREVSEETGSGQPLIVMELLRTFHRYEENGMHIDKTTHWFAMITQSRNFIPQSEEGIDDIRWLPLDEAEELVGYDNLKEVLQKFRAVLNASHHTTNLT